MSLDALAADVDKNAPDPAWIEDVRRRYPVESEIDRILTRRVERRAGPAYSPQTLPGLSEGVESLLKSQLDGPFRLENARWLTGGASKLQMSFDLDWDQPGVGRTRTPMVLRMEPAESIVETSRKREYQLIKALDGVVPVPPAYWVDADGSHLPYPGLIYGLVPGTTKPAAASTGVSGFGTNLGPDLRGPLGKQFVEHLAAIHTFDFSTADMSAFEVPQPGTTQSIEWALNFWGRVWEEDAEEEVPLLTVAAQWLRQNMPANEYNSIVHGDYRTGNYLFVESEARISALLDWELGRLGDRHQDLAYVASPTWGHLAEDGKTFLASGVMPVEEFLETYERLSGLTVDQKRLNYYQVYNAYMLAVLTFATSYRIVRGGKTHQDILVSWVLGIGGTLLENIRQLLEEGM